MTAPLPMRSRVINFVPVASGANAALGQVSLGIIDPGAGETAAGVWDKPSVRVPCELGCSEVLFDRPYGAPLPSRIIRYQGINGIPSKYHFDARTMSAGLGLTFFEGWATTIAKMVGLYQQRVMALFGRPFPIFDTTLTPWSWPNHINDAGFQDCPGVLNMADLSYIRHQLEDWLDGGCAEFFFDATGQDEDPTAGRYDTTYKLIDALGAAGTYTDADFTNSLANSHARAVGFESMPHRSSTEWMAAKAGSTWVATSDGVSESFDVRIGDANYLQPDEMQVIPVARFQGSDQADYDAAMNVLETYPNVRVLVKFYAMYQNGFDMAAMLAAGSLAGGSSGGRRRMATLTSTWRGRCAMGAESVRWDFTGSLSNLSTKYDRVETLAEGQALGAETTLWTSASNAVSGVTEQFKFLMLMVDPDGENEVFPTVDVEVTRTNTLDGSTAVRVVRIDRNTPLVIATSRGGATFTACDGTTAFDEVTKIRARNTLDESDEADGSNDVDVRLLMLGLP